MNHSRIFNRPKTAMELAFQKAARKYADKAYKPLTSPPAPPRHPPTDKK